MSGANSIAPGVVEAKAERASFTIPDNLSARYDVRIVAGSGGDERRLGLFTPRNRQEPAIEIVDARIIAREDDPETIASIVKLAEHNKWDRIEVEGSPAFRKAVWTAATRAGLTVGGYEPTFAEAERLERQRRDEVEARTRQGAPSKATTTMDAVADADRGDEVISAAKQAVTEQAVPQAPATSDIAPSPSVAGVLSAREGGRPDDRAAIEQLFERGIRSLEAQGDARAVEIRVMAAALVDQMYGEQEEQAVTQPASDREPRRDADHREDAGRHRAEASECDGSEQLADLFLHGAAEKIAADPRLSNALRAQSDMERHIAEVFPGASDQAAAATLQSRELISDVLRRGLDVSARASFPVQRIEPRRSPELER